MAAEKDAVVTSAQLMEMFREVLLTRTPEQANAMTPEALRDILDRQAQRTDPNNPFPPGISEFNPLGENLVPRPRLDVITYVNGHREDETQLTAFEIHAYNAVARSIPKPQDRREVRSGRIKAERSKNGDQIHIVWPCKTEDDRSEFNRDPITVICMELAEGPNAVHQGNLVEELAKLKAELAAMKSVPVPA